MSTIIDLLSSTNTELVAYIKQKLCTPIDIMGHAIRENNQRIFDSLIEKINIGEKPTNADTLVVLSAKHGRPQMLRSLIHSGAKIEDSALIEVLGANPFTKNHTECLLILSTRTSIEKNDDDDNEDNSDYYMVKLLKKITEGKFIDTHHEKIVPTERNARLSRDGIIPKDNHLMDKSSQQVIIDQLCKCITENNILTFNQLIKLDIDVNMLDSDNNSTMIMHAAQYGRYEMMHTLLGRGSCIDNDFPRNKSALSFVMNDYNTFNKDHIKCILLLLKEGADINILKKHSTKNYHIAKFIKKSFKPKLIKDENITNPMSIQESTTAPDTKFIIKIRRAGPYDKFCTVEHETSGELIVKMYGSTITSGKIDSKNISVEIPTRGSFHVLPPGIIVNGVKLDKETICRFTEGFVVASDGYKTLYHPIDKMY